MPGSMYPTDTMYAGPEKARSRLIHVAACGMWTVRCTSESERDDGRTRCLAFETEASDRELAGTKSKRLSAAGRELSIGLPARAASRVVSKNATRRPARREDERDSPSQGDRSVSGDGFGRRRVAVHIRRSADHVVFAKTTSSSVSFVGFRWRVIRCVRHRFASYRDGLVESSLVRDYRGRITGTFRHP